jgi:myo-inositol-1(or 4)-monophosphatase
MVPANSGTLKATSDISSLLPLVAQIARNAGVFLRDHRDKITIVEYSRRDVKIDADRRAEDLIAQDLRKLADFPILSEEAGLTEPQTGSSDYRWIVDPLDGTMNYLRGIPFNCVSIALWHADAPVLGAIYSFSSDEVFTGVVGHGASLSGHAIQVSETREERDAVLFTGFPAGGDFQDECVERFVRQVLRFKKIRMIGSAALSLAYVAAGRGDAYYERDIRIWDVAAGLAIVLAAGGKIEVTKTDKQHSVIAYAGNAHIQPLFV